MNRVKAAWCEMRSSSGRESRNPVRKVTSALESAGFAYVRTEGSHAVYRSADGRVVIIPEHDTIKRGTLGSTWLF